MRSRGTPPTVAVFGRPVSRFGEEIERHLREREIEPQRRQAKGRRNRRG